MIIFLQLTRSHITGEFGDCSEECVIQTARSLFKLLTLLMKILRSNLADPRYNLVSWLYNARWEEGLYRLLSDGHCHTFNPENVSHSGLKGQHYVNLGLCLDYEF